MKFDNYLQAIKKITTKNKFSKRDYNLLDSLNMHDNFFVYYEGDHDNGLEVLRAAPSFRLTETSPDLLINGHPRYDMFNFIPGSIQVYIKPNGLFYDKENAGEELSPRQGEPPESFKMRKKLVSCQMMFSFHTEQGSRPNGCPEIYNPGIRAPEREELTMAKAFLEFAEALKEKKLPVMIPRSFVYCGDKKNLEKIVIFDGEN